MRITIGDIAEILEAEINDKDRSLKVDHLLTDSRSYSGNEGTLFFAISTPTTDATRFMKDLYDKGVRMFICRNCPDVVREHKDAVIIEYPDPVKALQKIASRRPGYGGEVVAITGSRGKTILKEWIFQLMSGIKRTVRSPRSYNSQIGVPLSMWEVTPSTELTLIEAGVSRAGEMSRLGECIQPDTVILTGIGEEHSEGFESKAAKVIEKVSLAHTKGVKRLIFCADDEDILAAVKELPEGILRIAWTLNDQPIASVRIEESGKDPDDPQFTLLNYETADKLHKGILKVRVTNKGDLRSACAALAFALSEKIADTELQELFSGVYPIDTRLSVSDGRNGCNIIYDSYTSDLSSLEPAVDFLARRRMPDQESVVIISDFAHSGGGERDEYAALADILRQHGVSKLIGVGKKMKEKSELFTPEDSFFDSVEELESYLRREPIKNACVLVKGSPDHDLGRIRELLEVRTNETVLEVNLDAMIRNYNYFRSKVPSTTGMIAMVKASGYGAGSYEIAKSLQDAGAAYLAVAVLDEGLDLRRQGITMPIMVMNPRVADYIEMFNKRLEPEIYTPSMLQDVIHQASIYGVKDYPIHIKLDTGMHRMGFIEEEIPELMETIGKQCNVRISSVFSHLATADCPDMDDYTEMQLHAFERCSEYMLLHSSYPFKRHILNSAGILRFPQYHYDMVRLGIGLYGVNTLPISMEKPLDTVSTLKAVIINLRERKKGESIGYARKGRLERDSKIATIPIGYADGMNRHFGNGTVKVLVNGCQAPTIGNICMDACMIDVTGIECNIGDTVQIFGPDMPISRLSDTLETIPYEILTSVSPRVKRIYYRE